MVTLIQRLEAKYETYSKLEKVLNKRQQGILKLVKKRKSFAIKDVEIAMPTISRNTLKKDILYLVNEGLLLKIGEGRGVRYYNKE